MIMVRHLPRSATFLDARSRIRPGVATIMCTVLYRRMMSSFSDVPPVVTMHWRGGSMCFPISLTMADVWSASSRVGMRINTAIVMMWMG